jgi:nucleoside-diphosphate-sugar epimerase
MIVHHNHSAETPRRVFVLGASGFIGRAVLGELQSRGITAVGWSSRDADLTQPEAATKIASLLQPDDSLLFVSALTPDRGRDAATMVKNIAMGKHVAEALERSPCRHVVYLGSDAVYADDAPLLTSESPCNPAGLHGVMHLAREVMLRTALQKSKTPLLILRPCAVYGPGDTHNSYGPNRFVRTALKDGKITLFGRGEEMRDHVFIDDLARLTVDALCRRSAGVLNVATGRSVSFYDVAQRVAATVGRAVEIAELPRSSPITHRHFEPAELLHAFPLHRSTSLDDGLAQLVQSEKTS